MLARHRRFTGEVPVRKETPQQFQLGLDRAQVAAQVEGRAERLILPADSSVVALILRRLGPTLSPPR